MRAFVHSFVRSFVRLFVRSFFRSFFRSFVHSFIPSFVRSFVRSFIYLFIYFIFILKRDVGTLSVPVIAVAEETDAGAASSSDLSAGGLAIVARELGNHLKSLLLVIVTLKDEAIPFFSPFSVVDD